MFFSYEEFKKLAYLEKPTRLGTTSPGLAKMLFGKESNPKVGFLLVSLTGLTIHFLILLGTEFLTQLID